MALALKYATLAQLGAAFRLRFRASKGIETARLASWLLDRIADGTFTDTQVRNFFGLTVTDYNTLKTRLTTLRTEYQDCLGSLGE